METSTVVPGGDLAGRSAEYRRGYVRGLAVTWPLAPVIALALAFATYAVAYAYATARADRAEAQLAELRAQQKQHNCVPWKMDRDTCLCQHFEPAPARGGTITIEPSQRWFSHAEDDVAVGTTIVEVR